METVIVPLEDRLSRLLVMIPDRLSELVEKGEITDRYYNPGNLFKQVDIVMTNDDAPAKDGIQRMVGDAELTLHNLPAGAALFARTLGWRPTLLHRWTSQAVELARLIGPQLIRCHGAHLNTFAAKRIKADLGIPYVASLHINPDEDVRKRVGNWKEWLAVKAVGPIERAGLLAADLALPVYRPIVPFLQRIGMDRFEVAYNVLNPKTLSEKTDYTIGDMVRVISVGRQFAAKNPDNLIKAVAQMPRVELTIVGDGSHHEYLRQVAADSGAAGRIIFHRALSNDELCNQLPGFDIFAVHTEYWEISKSVLEPLIAGLPVVINRRLGAAVPELDDSICRLVDNTVDDYKTALDQLINDDAARAQLGRSARAKALDIWLPERTERRYVEIYRRVTEAAQQ